MERYIHMQVSQLIPKVEIGLRFDMSAYFWWELGEVPFASLAYDFVLERHLTIIYSKYTVINLKKWQNC